MSSTSVVMIPVWVAVYWAMQAAAALIIAIGGRMPAWGVHAFVGGNVVAGLSLAVLMVLYRQMSVPVAYGIGVGGAVLCAQITLAVFFKTPFGPWHYAGSSLLVAGIACFALAK